MNISNFGGSWVGIAAALGKRLFYTFLKVGVLRRL
jgi:hypothetical protein